jgi:CubicO group peptidase (beta-lactamase class C family)
MAPMQRRLGRIKTPCSILLLFQKLLQLWPLLNWRKEHKLGLQDSIAKYFSGVPAKKAGVTIHQLLIHHSGIPQTYAAEGETGPNKAAGKIWNIKSELQPGKFVYSNGNHTLLAVIIEKVTGKKWEDNIKEAILAPLDMKNTYFREDKNNTGLPEAKPLNKAQKRRRDYGFLGLTGIFSTAADMLKFQNASKTNHVVNDSSRALWAGRHVKLKSAGPERTDYYAYGIFLTEGESSSIWLRGSEDAWGVSIVYWFPKSNTSIIVLSGKEKLSNGEKQHMYVSSQIIKALNQQVR